MQTKTRIVVAISLFLYAVFSSLIYAAEVELDCQKTTEWVEYTICKSDALLREDKKLAELSQNVMARVTDDIKTQIDSDQRTWLKKRDEHCRRNASEVENCLLAEYQERNAALSAFLAFDSSEHPSDEPLKILRITPHGHDVLASQQIVFQFNRPVVPIGRMERDANDIPVDISPTLNCEWRWLNSSALACQLREEAKMQQATRYNITMNPGNYAGERCRFKETRAPYIYHDPPKSHLFPFYKLAITRYAINPGNIQSTCNKTFCRTQLNNGNHAK